MRFDGEELKAIAKDVCKGKATAEHKRFIVAFYRKVFKRSFSRCKCQLCDAIFLILQNLDKMDTKFKLKKGIVLRQHGRPYRLTHRNITDQLAIEHLKAKPQDAKFFDYIPAAAWKVIRSQKTGVKADPEVLKNADPEVVNISTDPAAEKAEMIEEPVKKEQSKDSVNDDIAEKPKTTKKPRKRSKKNK